MLIRDRTAVVTGAGGTGCGRAIAARLAGDGAAVAVCDVNEEGGRETVHRIESAGGRAAFFRADVRDAGQVEALMRFARQTFGEVSVLINNASGPFRPGLDAEFWADTIATELLGTVHATRYALESMRRLGEGAIVNLASISAVWHGRRTPGGAAGYDAAKAGVIRFTTGLAGLAATDRVRVNCLAPGWIATDGPRTYWESLTADQRRERGVPAQLLTTDQVAEMVVRLAADDSLAGRVVLWWSEDAPRLIEWGDRGYLEGRTLG